MKLLLKEKHVRERYQHWYDDRTERCHHHWHARCAERRHCSMVQGQKPQEVVPKRRVYTDFPFLFFQQEGYHESYTNQLAGKADTRTERDAQRCIQSDGHASRCR